MRAQKFKRVQSEDRVLNQVQDHIAQIVDPLLRLPLLPGRFIQNIILDPSSDNVIDHKLNRPLQGWFIVGKSSESDIWDKQASNPMPERTLILKSSANVTISLWVF